MIFYFFLKFFVSVIGYMLTPLTTVTTLPLGLDTSLTTIYGLYHAATSIFPYLSIAINYVLLGFSIELAYYGWKFIRMIMNLVRGAGS